MNFLYRVMVGVVRALWDLVSSEAAKVVGTVMMPFSAILFLAGLARWLTAGPHPTGEMSPLWLMYVGAPGTIVLGVFLFWQIIQAVRYRMPPPPRDPNKPQLPIG